MLAIDVVGRRSEGPAIFITKRFEQAKAERLAGPESIAPMKERNHLQSRRPKLVDDELADDAALLDETPALELGEELVVIEIHPAECRPPAIRVTLQQHVAGAEG